MKSVIYYNGDNVTDDYRGGCGGDEGGCEVKELNPISTVTVTITDLPSTRSNASNDLEITFTPHQIDFVLKELAKAAQYKESVLDGSLTLIVRDQCSNYPIIEKFQRFNLMARYHNVDLFIYIHNYA